MKTKNTPQLSKAKSIDTWTELQTLGITPHGRELGIHKQLFPESKILKV